MKFGRAPTTDAMRTGFAREGNGRASVVSPLLKEASDRVTPVHLLTFEVLDEAFCYTRSVELAFGGDATRGSQSPTQAGIGSQGLQCAGEPADIAGRDDHASPALADRTRRLSLRHQNDGAPACHRLVEL